MKFTTNRPIDMEERNHFHPNDGTPQHGSDARTEGHREENDPVARGHDEKADKQRLQHQGGEGRDLGAKSGLFQRHAQQRQRAVDHHDDGARP